MIKFIKKTMIYLLIIMTLSTAFNFSSFLSNSISNKDVKYVSSFDKYSDKASNNTKNLDSPASSTNLSTKEYNWYFKHVKNGEPPLPPPESASFISKYNACYLGDTSKKVLYLTFDEGYENGYTAPILDVLKKHNVKAAFFVVKPYITSNPDLIKRMVDEGHLVCNHSNHHPSMASITDKAKFNKELSDVEDAFYELTGKKMPKYFRPPMGKYSETSLKLTEEYGYKTVFWSFAYADWDTKKQPSLDFAKKRILEKTHNGAIILLHAVSKTNAEILDSLITEWKNQGYELKSLEELP